MKINFATFWKSTPIMAKNPYFLQKSVNVNLLKKKGCRPVCDLISKSGFEIQATTYCTSVEAGG